MQVKGHGRFDATVAFEIVLNALSWQTMMWSECHLGKPVVMPAQDQE